VAFQSNCAGSYDLEEVNVVDGKRVWLTSSEEFDELEPNYSADGTKLVFQRVPRGAEHDFEGEILSLDLTLGVVRELGLRGRGPVWSPDTMHLAYMSARSGSWQVYVYDFIRSREQLVSTTCPGHCRWPEWSPDGQALAYTSSNSIATIEANSIWIYSFVDGSNRLWMQGGVGRPSWSSIGAIVFEARGGVEWALVDGSNRQRLLEFTEAWAPTWAR
jgi:Tol biopolymer transport system component